MPRFFFDRHNGSDVVSDLDGQILSGTQNAKSVAADSVVDLTREAVLNEYGQSLAVVVRDEGGDEIAKVRVLIEWWH
ncbi:DUF6894 family protein [Terrihabitans rhizophilus]|uniref:DUF6894 domain-containing protein n=1 Tax=Terrihabitans rhizophilus TaxID=3092662 RepID=A0ABU4RTB1_9HYPH|nr:hypothetical protein [Terrihabitans sp. PJ23]MDX6806920.1 hypothetical protein [Terrihabitans sp. PJ23]